MNSKGYLIFLFSFITFPLNWRQPFFYLFTFKSSFLPLKSFFPFQGVSPFYLITFFTFLPLKVPFYLFTFKTAGSSRRFRVLFVLKLKAVMLQAEQPVVLRLDRQQVWA